MLYHITFTGVRRMKKSPYDRERFFEKYSQMDRSLRDCWAPGSGSPWSPCCRTSPGSGCWIWAAATAGTASMRRNTGAAAVTGVDLSEKMLAVAREKTTAPQVTYIRGMMAETPFPPGEL